MSVSSFILVLSAVMMSAVNQLNDERRCARCRYGKCRSFKCHGALKSFFLPRYDVEKKIGLKIVLKCNLKFGSNFQQKNYFNILSQNGKQSLGFNAIKTFSPLFQVRSGVEHPIGAPFSKPLAIPTNIITWLQLKHYSLFTENISDKEMIFKCYFFLLGIDILGT